jgi:hypothetical protein
MLSEFSGNEPFNVNLNINMMNDYKHEMITSCQYFLCKTFGESFHK